MGISYSGGACIEELEGAVIPCHIQMESLYTMPGVCQRGEPQ